MNIEQHTVALREVQHESMRLQTENDSLRQQLEMAEACLAGDDALIAGLTSDIVDKAAEIERLRQQLIGLQGRFEKAKEQIETGKEEETRLNEEPRNRDDFLGSQGEVIDSLRQQLAEKDAEIERLKSEERSHNMEYGDVHDSYTKASLELAASQAREQQLRDALSDVIWAATERDKKNRIRQFDEYINTGCDLLAIPTDTSALDRIKAGYEAQIQQLREALEDANDFVERHSNRWDGINGKHPCTVVESSRKALALPTDTTDLEAMIAKVGEVMRERCWMTMLEHYGCNETGPVADAIRALPGVKLEDLQK